MALLSTTARFRKAQEFIEGALERYNFDDSNTRKLLADLRSARKRACEMLDLDDAANSGSTMNGCSFLTEVERRYLSARLDELENAIKFVKGWGDQ